MAGEKLKDVIVISDSDDLTDEDLTDASSFHSSCSESDPSQSDDDYQQLEDDDHTDEDAKPGADDDTVLHLLQENREIGHLNLKVYRAYLRKHGLRISGTKAECLMRIHEHWRIRNGEGEALYPISSFTINCTGDVCKGDVVKFRQRVYQKFDKLTKSGKVQGSRIVAGRVVKESYGATKQQHTFTVEVLWSKGTNKLPSMFPLLVKGRNLYRLKTFRQPWKNEAERSITLDEKHKRGAVAREKRSIRIQGRKMQTTRQPSDTGPMLRKNSTQSNHTRDCPNTHLERGKQGNQRGKTSANLLRFNDTREGSRICKPAMLHEKLSRDGNKASTSESFPYQQFRGLQMQSDNKNAQFGFPRVHVLSSHAGGYYGPHIHHRPPGSYSYPYSSSAIPLPAFNSSSCSTRGCRNLKSEGCAISGCWHCCHRAGLRCHVHNHNTNFW